MEEPVPYYAVPPNGPDSPAVQAVLAELARLDHEAEKLEKAVTLVQYTAPGAALTPCAQEALKKFRTALNAATRSLQNSPTPDISSNGF